MDREALARIIWDKPFSEVTEMESSAVVQQYPFFSAARFLHLHKLDSNSDAYGNEYQKSILFYHDPTAFPLFLNPPDDIVLDALEKPEMDGENHPVDTVENVPDVVQHDIKRESPTALVEPPAVTSDDLLLFEPFHTVDYFASQGIKPSPDDIPKDKFGKQLKSFTDWLKVMKKISPTDITKDTGVDKNVVDLAAHSVEEASVITESMAEVWLKQGNKEKAVQTYKKLSLQNPAKSAYFAAKIRSITE